MNLQIQFVVIAGFILILLIPTVIIAIAVVWGDRIHIAKYNFWIAAGIGVFSIFLYILLIFGMSQNKETGSLVGTIATCVIGTLFGQLIFFMGAFIRQAFIRSLGP